VSRSKVIKGVKRSNLFFNRPKNITISNGKNKSANVFHMDREAKVFTVTPLSDLSLRVKGQKRSNFEVFCTATWIFKVTFYL